MAMLPIHYQSPRYIVRHAIIDDERYPIRSQRHWYLSSRTKLASPRFSVDLPADDGTTQLSHFFLNRVVQASLITTPDQFLSLWNDLGALWNFIKQIPRVRFENGDPFDCRAHNIHIKMKSETTRRRAREFNPVILPDYNAVKGITPPPEITSTGQPLDPSQGLRPSDPVDLPSLDYRSIAAPSDGYATAAKFLEALGPTDNPIPPEKDRLRRSEAEPSALDPFAKPPEDFVPPEGYSEPLTFTDGHQTYASGDLEGSSDEVE
jgi:hypothetical protein